MMSEKSRKKYRGALFGTGFWSRFQIPAWGEIEDVEIVALYNRTVSKAEAAAKQFDVPGVYDDPCALLENEQVDFIDIVVEAPAHEWIVGLGAQYGVPVICQKPMAHDMQTCERMISVCEKAGIPLLIHENFRWQHPIRLAGETLRRAPLGKIVRANIQFSHGGAEAFGYQPYLHTIDHAGLLDMGCHIIDVARFFFGEISSVYCRSIKALEFMKGDDTFTCVLQQGDTVCTCEVASRTPFKVFVEGTEGTLLLDNDDRMTVTTKNGAEVRSCSAPPDYSWMTPELAGLCCPQSIVACHRHMLDSLKGIVPCETSAAETMKTMRAVFAAIESAVSGKAVML